MDRLRRIGAAVGAVLLATGVAACWVPAVRSLAIVLLSSAAAAVAQRFYSKHREDTATGRMKVRVCRGLHRLRRAAGREALRAPWYVVIGAQQAGKSSIVDAAQLLVHAEAVPEPAPEPHARLLSTSDGTIIDTPGRLTHPGHRREFCALLQQLRRRLGARRMGGIVLCVRLEELRQGDALAERLRPVLAAALGALGRQVPVTLVLTQADALPGFQAAFARSDKLREQPWGFSLADNDEVALSASNRMATLVETLRRFCVGQLGVDDDGAQRAQLYMFPQTLSAFARPLQHVVEGVFGARASSDALRLAGIYLCAAPPPAAAAVTQTQSLLPAEAQTAATLGDWQRMLPDASSPGTMRAPAVPQVASTSIQHSLQLASPSLEPRQTTWGGPEAYFVSGLFGRVLGHHASMNVPLFRAGLRGLWASAPRQCAAALVLVVFGLAALRSAALNVLLQRQVHRAIAPLMAQPQQHDLHQALQVVGPLAETHEARRRLGVPYGMRWGLYRNDALTEPLTRLYVALMDTLIIGDPRRDFARTADRLWQQYGLVHAPLDAAPSSVLLTQLHAHLLLTTPKASSEPTLMVHSEQQWLITTLVGQLLQAAGDSVDVPQQTALTAHIARYVTLHARLPELLRPRHVQRVAEARSLLARRPLPDRLVDAIESDATRLGEPVGVEQLISLGQLPLRFGKQVLQAYTKQGYEQIAKPALDALNHGGSAWVFEPLPESMAARRELVAATHARYFGRYAAAWLGFVEGLAWRPTNTVWSARQLLDTLTSDHTPPIAALLEAIAGHTDHLSGGSGAASAGMRPLFTRLLGKTQADSTGTQSFASRIEHAEDVEALFAPLRRWLGRAPQAAATQSSAPMALYQEQLLALKQAVTAFLDDPGAAQMLDEPLRQTRLNVQGLLDTLPAGSGFRPRLYGLLLGPIEQVTRALTRGVRARSDGSWGPEVVQTARALLRQYPFYAGGVDASPAEVFAYFRPGSGTLWGYHRRELAHDIVRQGPAYVFDERMGGVVRHAYRPEVLRYFTSAQAVTDALYPAGDGSEPTLELEVRLLGAPQLEGAELEYDGHTLRVARGAGSSSWQRWQWPPRGEEAPKTILRAQGRLESSAQWQHEGVWALWRLIESGKAQIERSNHSLTVFWPVGGHASAVGLEVRPLRRNHPFFEPDGRGGVFATLRKKSLWPPGTLTPSAGDHTQARLMQRTQVPRG